jgi:hypothetical protein
MIHQISGHNSGTDPQVRRWSKNSARLIVRGGVLCVCVRRTSLPSRSRAALLFTPAEVTNHKR